MKRAQVPWSFVIDAAGTMLVEAGDRGRLTCWSLRNDDLLGEIDLGERVSLDLSPDGSTLLAWTNVDSSGNGSLFVVRMPSLELVRQKGFSGGVSWQLSPRFSTSGRFIGALTQSIRVIDGQGYQASTFLWTCDAKYGDERLMPLPAISGDLRAFSPDETTVALDQDSGIIVVPLTGSEALQQVPKPDRSSSSTFSPDWRYVVHAGPAGSILVQDAGSQRIVSKAAGLNVRLANSRVFFTNSQRRCVWLSNVGLARVFSFPDAENLATFQATNTSPAIRRGCVFSKDERLMAAYIDPPTLGWTIDESALAEATPTLNVWSIETGQLAGRLVGFVGRVVRCLFDESRLFALDRGGTLRAWDTKSWKNLWTLEPDAPWKGPSV